MNDGVAMRGGGDEHQDAADEPGVGAVTAEKREPAHRRVDDDRKIPVLASVALSSAIFVPTSPAAVVVEEFEPRPAYQRVGDASEVPVLASIGCTAAPFAPPSPAGGKAPPT